MQNIEAENQRHAQSSLLDREPLRPIDDITPVKVEDAANLAGANVLRRLTWDDWASGSLPGRDEVELAELLLERHGAQKGLNPAHGVAHIIIVVSTVRLGADLGLALAEQSVLNCMYNRSSGRRRRETVGDGAVKLLGRVRLG